jgi:hypothetical protein
MYWVLFIIYFYVTVILETLAKFTLLEKLKCVKNWDVYHKSRIWQMLHYVRLWNTDTRTWSQNMSWKVHIFLYPCKIPVPIGKFYPFLNMCHVHHLRVLNVTDSVRLHCSLYHSILHHNKVEEIILIRSNEMQQYAGLYLLQNYSTCFGFLSHPSSGIHQTVTAASGTGHSVRSSSYSFMYSWWWVW